MGYVRVIARQHTVVEAKMDNEMEDLRLHDAFAELLQFCQQQDMNSMDEKQFREYIVVMQMFTF